MWFPLFTEAKQGDLGRSSVYGRFYHFMEDLSQNPASNMRFLWRLHIYFERKSMKPTWVRRYSQVVLEDVIHIKLMNMGILINIPTLQFWNNEIFNKVNKITCSWLAQATDNDAAPLGKFDLQGVIWNTQNYREKYHSIFETTCKTAHPLSLLLPIHSLLHS